MYHLSLNNLLVLVLVDTYQSLWNIIVATATLSSLASLANKIFRRGSIAPSLGAVSTTCFSVHTHLKNKINIIASHCLEMRIFIVLSKRT